MADSAIRRALRQEYPDLSERDRADLEQALMRLVEKKRKRRLDQNAMGPQLRQVRRRRSLTLEHAAAHMKCSVSKLSRIESGIQLPTGEEVYELLQFYGFTDPSKIQGWVKAANEARRRSGLPTS